MTHRNIRRRLLGTAFAGGLLAFGGVAANAADTTSGTDGLLSGTQVVAPVTVRITAGATSLGLIGDSAAGVEGSGTATGTTTAPAAPVATNGADGILSGTQIITPITLPISLGATSVGVIGDSTATVVNPPAVTPPVVTPPAAQPAASTPAAQTPAAQPAAGSAEVRAAATTAPMSLGHASVPCALANTGVNTGMLIVGLLLLAFGGLLTVILRRKRS